MFITTAGGVVASAQIVDDSIVNADINSAAAIAQSKLAAGLGGNTDLFSVERTVGTTHSLTTVAGQRVLVFAKGACSGTATQTLTLKYNTVTKDTVTRGIAGGDLIYPFALTYTEVPGAATQNITVETDGGVLSNVVITVLKLKSA